MQPFKLSVLSCRIFKLTLRSSSPPRVKMIPFHKIVFQMQHHVTVQWEGQEKLGNTVRDKNSNGDQSIEQHSI